MPTASKVNITGRKSKGNPEFLQKTLKITGNQTNFIVTYRYFELLKELTVSGHITKKILKEFLSEQRISYHALNYHIKKMESFGWIKYVRFNGFRLTARYKVTGRRQRAVDPHISNKEFKLRWEEHLIYRRLKAQRYVLIAKNGKQSRKLPLSDPSLTISTKGLSKLLHIGEATVCRHKRMMMYYRIMRVERFKREIVMKDVPWGYYNAIMDMLPSNMWFHKGSIYQRQCDNLIPVLCDN